MANVVNIRENIRLKKDMIFAVDTNVLLWFLYEKSYYAANAYQKKYYPDFLSLLIQQGHKLIATIYNISEMFNVIEKNEFEIYKRKNNGNLKRFRQNKECREKLKDDISLIYEQADDIFDITCYPQEKKIIEGYLNDYLEHMCDFYDFSLIDYCYNNKIDGIITDDKDFYYSCKNIDVYTANEQYINLVI